MIRRLAWKLLHLICKSTKTLINILTTNFTKRRFFYSVFCQKFTRISVYSPKKSPKCHSKPAPKHKTNFFFRHFERTQQTFKTQTSSFFSAICQKNCKQRLSEMKTSSIAEKTLKSFHSPANFLLFMGLKIISRWWDHSRAGRV